MNYRGKWDWGSDPAGAVLAIRPCGLTLTPVHVGQLGMALEGFPETIRPMQAVSAEAPFRSSDYLFEVKWDGLRCVVHIDPEGRVRIHDRALHAVTDLLPELAHLGRQVKGGCVLDGEVVATDSDGRPDHLLLRRRLALGSAGRDQIPVAFLAFDLLWMEGKPQMRQPLERRRARLANVVTGGGHIYVPDCIDSEGVDLFEACLERGLEGVVAKHRKSTYVPGQRSPFWLKVKAVKSDDFVVIGYTPGAPFGALLVAYWEGGRLLPCGSLSGGWDQVQEAELAQAMQQLLTDQCPLEPAPQFTRPVQWCQPQLVISARYSEWTPDSTLRFPIFNGLRPEVHPAECVRHRPRVVAGVRTATDSPSYWLTRFPF